MPRSGAEILADALRGFGVPMVSLIPGEGILELVDALAVRAPSIRLASFRHEAGMAYAAQAAGQLSGVPGICLAARAPGALNTTLAIHTAYTDSAPMIMVIGQASMDVSGREAMLNADDFQRVFGPLTKWVGVIDSPARIGEMLSRAWHVALSGRRGPVVLVMPENVAQQRVVVRDPLLPKLPQPAISTADMATFRERVTHAKQPVLVAGGTGWTDASLRSLTALAARHVIPVATTYRRRDLIDHDDAGFIGEIGLGVDPALAKRIADADLLIVLNGRLGELNTVGAGSFKGFTLLDPARETGGDAMHLVHLHADANEINTVYRADLAVQVEPNGFVASWLDATSTSDDSAWIAPAVRDARTQWRDDARRDRLRFIESGRCEGPVDLRAIYATLDAALQPDAVVTSGAGSYAVWPQRYLKHRRYGTQLGPKSGAMGYGLSAAIGAALTLGPDRQVVAIAGDGCLMMHAEELETAVRLRISLLLIVVNNCSYGAIDGAQRRMFGRATGTALGAIDFAAFARSFGADGVTVTDTAGFAPALQRALDAPGVKLIELRVPSSVGKPLS
ncbi:thiamine pyrophosphate-dependent enzyme [Paraburkholderia sp.]|uniref:thiamine pyrophosphate-dependent enzyme n=1 Tax=Paraburkholderia sp. TaxID=1926495 RepID=UPI0023A350D4|nr:thiamine pyrophosphate-dependent enzyme [Paraburkholderia sp.]MDE1181916.1 thiamine pyrophosphate-binding protein [Paraburkholderia sp.]